MYQNKKTMTIHEDVLATKEYRDIGPVLFQYISNLVYAMSILITKCAINFAV